MDNSEYRRGKPCWYRRTGLTAINDASLLKTTIFVLLREHFRDHPAYNDFVELFNDVGLRTEMGQLCDTSPRRGVDEMTRDVYSFIAVNKTADYSFYLPVVLALQYLGLGSEGRLGLSARVLLPMGTLFQVQDDYLDVYGDSEVTGRVGSDVCDNKCTWLVVEALCRCDERQRRALGSAYGRRYDGCEEIVKEVFRELGMQSVYREYEDVEALRLQREIENIDDSHGLLKGVFNSVLEKIMYRDS